MSVNDKYSSWQFDYVAKAINNTYNYSFSGKQDTSRFLPKVNVNNTPQWNIDFHQKWLTIPEVYMVK